ncbi:MAG: Ppx/GppA phosphatase family protein [Alteraurantiacibacter sp.]
MADTSPPDGRRNGAGIRKRKPGRRPNRKPDRKRPFTGKSPGPSRAPAAAADSPTTVAPTVFVPNVFAARTPGLHTSGPRHAYAAIDLGTNNCRLLIARPDDENFVVIDAFSRVVRLGEGLAQTGRLSTEAMDRALGALKICSDKLRKRNVHLARSVATEACRQAENGAEFVARVAQETGILLDIISAEEEARLAVLGCHKLLEDGPGPALIFDIGGGSTELVLIDSTGIATTPDGLPGMPRIVDWASVPWGVVSLSETLGDEHVELPARLERYAAMRQKVTDSLTRFATRLDPHRAPDLRLLGTSGTVTTLASIHLDLPQYNRQAVDGLVVASTDMRAISQRLSGLSLDERRLIPCVGNERSGLVVAGCAILEAIMDIWPAARLGVADRGIREGILRSLMAAETASPNPPLARGTRNH